MNIPTAEVCFAIKIKINQGNVMRIFESKNDVIYSL